MIRAVVYGLLIAAAVLIQSAWLARLQLWGAVIDPLLPLVLAIGIFRGAEGGALAGLAAGWVQDLLSGAAIGVHVLSKLVVGFAAGLFEQSIYAEDPFLPAVATFVATVLGELVLLGVLVVTGLAPLSWPRTPQTVLVQAVMNSAIAPVVFRGVRAIERQIQKRELGS